ncbi:hypothetical protein ACFQX6_58670 [Streptosporangium lutulentum]
MTQSPRGGDRAALAYATIIRNRTLAALPGPPSAAVIQQMVDEIHACCPQQTRFKCRRSRTGGPWRRASITSTPCATGSRSSGAG